MKATLNVYSPGSKVTIGNDIDATILAVSIGPQNHTEYNCAYWNGYSRETQWLDQSEILPREQNTTKIGFVK